MHTATNASIAYDFDRPIRIATRKSPLAMWQAEHVRDQLMAHYPDIKVELIKVTTQGDIILDSPLAKIGGKGLFIKELEQRMLAGEADIAVHSMKDVPAQFEPGFVLSAILKREAPYDAWVSNHYASIDALPQGATVGTCSLRRAAQLQAYRPDVVIRDLRGNVGTRLAKLDAGEFDGIILAQAGLLRLEMPERIAQVISDDVSLPAVGQGAVGIETCEDPEVIALMQGLADPQTTYRVSAERAMNATLQGGCQVPIAGFATFSASDAASDAQHPLAERQLTLRGLVASTDGQTMLRATREGMAQEAEEIGHAVAQDLLDQGAREVLDAILEDNDESS